MSLCEDSCSSKPHPDAKTAIFAWSLSRGVWVLMMVGGGSGLGWCQQLRLRGRLCHHQT